MQDVVPWAKQNLNVLRGRQSRSRSPGTTNGGGCAAYFGAKYPEVFGNILAVSPARVSRRRRSTTRRSRRSSRRPAAYDAVKPANIMTSKTPYTDTVAIFTVGENDPTFAPGTQRLADAATAAAIDTTLFRVPGADHGASALDGGLEEGFGILYPRLGLAALEADPDSESEPAPAP